jgi:hypothetical protein
MKDGVLYDPAAIYRTLGVLTVAIANPNRAVPGGLVPAVQPMLTAKLETKRRPGRRATPSGSRSCCVV